MTGGLALAAGWFGPVPAACAETPLKQPNIVLLFADDISARELPVYRSSVWSDPLRKTTSDPAVRATTPVLDRLAHEGCWITTAWAATVCRPSRAMIMTGRYAHQQKWWNNRDIGVAYDDEGKLRSWPVYESSPLLLSHVTSGAGYGTFWAGKFHLSGDYEKFGFDEAVFTPGLLTDTGNTATDFKLTYKKVKGKRTLINQDTGEPVNTYAQDSWYFNPHVLLMNHPSAPDQTVWWPNTPESKKAFGLNTYGPDVELKFTFDFMDRMHAQDKPFFIYHASHLGHDAFNWFDPDEESKWPQTPKIVWDGERYTRGEPNITGDDGVYDTHGSLSDYGLHSHINYLDYQVWLYTQKLEAMGELDNTVFVFTADNGTGGYGKNTSEQQRGCHVPMIIYAPGMTKQGRQDVMVSIADMLPTFADLAGFEIPADYDVDGQSLVPFLFTDKPIHRDWVYSYRGPEQIVRTPTMLRDGRHKWWDVREEPEDLTSFPGFSPDQITAPDRRAEKTQLEEVLSRYDLYDQVHDAPGVPPQPPIKGKGRPYYRGPGKK